MANTEISLADAAHRLGRTWASTWTLVLTGALHGRKRGSRWFVLAKDVDALCAAAASGERAPVNRQKAVRA